MNYGVLALITIFATTSSIDADNKVIAKDPFLRSYVATLKKDTPAKDLDYVRSLSEDYLCLVAHKQEIFFLWRPLLRDPNDDMVVELAVASQADAIVTHNLRDFSAAASLGIRVLAPGPFLLHLSRR